jgi:hypothetical protein
MSDASSEDILGWVEKCVANPEVALATAQRMIEADPGAEKQYLVHASRFLALGRLALIRAERNSDDRSDEILTLCLEAIREYSLARNAQDSTSVKEEVRKETVVIKPAGIFTKARTEVRETKLQKTHNVMDWPPFENHLDGVAIILEKARPKSVQRLLGKTKLLYLLMADRLSNSNAVQNRMNENESIRADVRSLCGIFIEAPFEIGCALVASYLGTGTICCKLYEELEPFGPEDRQCPGSILIAMKGSNIPWTISPVGPISIAA